MPNAQTFTGFHASPEFMVTDEEARDIQIAIGHTPLAPSPTPLLEERTVQLRAEESTAAQTENCEPVLEVGKRVAKDLAYLSKLAVKGSVNLGIDGTFGVIGRVCKVFGVAGPEDVE